MTRDAAIIRLKAVEGEFAAARFSLEHTVRHSRRDPSLLDFEPGLAVRDLHRSALHVEVTYIVRMFAEFEGTLRTFWTTIKRTDPNVTQLLDGLVARRRITGDLPAETHEVRRYRNGIVHEGQMIARIPFTVCRSRLCRFLAFLPEPW